MIATPPENTIVVLESPEIYDGWSAAVLSNGDIINRWDPEKEPRQYLQTIKLIQIFIEQQEPRGFEGDPD